MFKLKYKNSLGSLIWVKIDKKIAEFPTRAKARQFCLNNHKCAPGHKDYREILYIIHPDESEELFEEERENQDATIKEKQARMKNIQNRYR